MRVFLSLCLVVCCLYDGGAAQAGRVYYLAVGVGHYTQRAWPRLDSPPQDARTLTQALNVVWPGETTLLIDQQATKRRIAQEVARIAGCITAQDAFVFYFSGHGGSDAVRGARVNYLQPVDSSPADYRHEITDAELAGWLARFPAPQHVLLLLDSCHAAAFAQGVVHAPRGAAYTILAAAGADESSLDAGGGSLFTRNLREGLTFHRAQLDTNGDGLMSASELFAYAGPRTTADAHLYRARQHPQQLGGDMMLW
ncbi:MAG TPA: caspase family protein [Armatimonadota bacterium]|jgi:uncharacterized caspase-like protein